MSLKDTQTTVTKSSYLTTHDHHIVHCTLTSATNKLVLRDLLLSPNSLVHYDAAVRRIKSRIRKQRCEISKQRMRKIIIYQY